MPDLSPDNPFVFIAEDLALDFVNTEVMVRNQYQDLLATPADLLAWWQMAQTHYPQPETVEIPSELVNEEWLGGAKYLRGALRGIFTAIAAGHVADERDTRVLNHFLRMGYPVLEGHAAGEFTPLFRTDGNECEQTLINLALTAFRLLTERDLSRLHKCKNERCILLFYDTTKSATRRWHSPECQNRARSIENYQRQRRK